MNASALLEEHSRITSSDAAFRRAVMSVTGKQVLPAALEERISE